MRSAWDKRKCLCHPKRRSGSWVGGQFPWITRCAAPWDGFESMGMSPPKVAIIAALEREVASAVKHWRVSHLQSLGRRFKIFETEGAAVICSGIGAAAAKAATDAAIGQFNPVLTVSLGFAGALTPELKVGKGVFSPYKVVDAATGAEFHTIAEEANGTLVSAAAIAVRGEKRELALRYQALAVDMEAAAVAQAAST